MSGRIADEMHDHFHPDATDEISNEDWKRLDDFVAQWWADVKPTSYEPDFSRCVLMGPRT